APLLLADELLHAPLDDAVLARGAPAEEAAELVELLLRLIDLLRADGLLELERLGELLAEDPYEALALCGVRGVTDAVGELERLALQLHLALDAGVERLIALGQLPEVGLLAVARLRPRRTLSRRRLGEEVRLDPRSLRLREALEVLPLQHVDDPVDLEHGA